MKGTVDLQARKKGAILGMFIGDALAMPVHWYYDRQALYRDYGHVTSYQRPKNPHPDSILWRSVDYVTDRSFDILHDQRKYWGRHCIHYHQFLQAGENTLNLKLCGLLIDTIVENGTYDSDAYLERYIDFAFGYTSSSSKRRFARRYTCYQNSKPGQPIGGVSIFPLAKRFRRDGSWKTCQ